MCKHATSTTHQVPFGAAALMYRPMITLCMLANTYAHALNVRCNANMMIKSKLPCGLSLPCERFIFTHTLSHSD